MRERAYETTKKYSMMEAQLVGRTRCERASTSICTPACARARFWRRAMRRRVCMLGVMIPVSLAIGPRGRAGDCAPPWRRAIDRTHVGVQLVGIHQIVLKVLVALRNAAAPPAAAARPRRMGREQGADGHGTAAAVVVMPVADAVAIVFVLGGEAPAGGRVRARGGGRGRRGNVPCACACASCRGGRRGSVRPSRGRTGRI